MEEKIIEKMEESINKILDEGLNTTNLDTMYKLNKIKHLAKEDQQMNNEYGRRGYGEYGRGGMYGEYNGYGNYGNYGRRGYDARYRGHDYIERMGENYGRYEEGRRNYGANADTMKSLEYMLESATDFFRMLKEEAKSQDEVNMIRQYAQKISQM